MTPSDHDSLGLDQTLFPPRAAKQSGEGPASPAKSDNDRSLGEMETIGGKVAEPVSHDLNETQFVQQSIVTPLSEGISLGNNYRLDKRLGRGGMGEAWKASDLMADRNVVVKLIPTEVRNVEAAMQQVRATFLKVHALQHQHICPMMGLIEDPNYGVYIVMKFIDGITLDVYRKNFVAEHGRFPVSETAKILWDVARALDYSHERKILHRDVKPQNIMISVEDGVQLIDFGLAAEIRESMMSMSDSPMDMAGTRPYMAPEQWRGRLQDAQTDQYALAVTAYELIAGHVPFLTQDVRLLKEQVLHTEPKPIANVAKHVNAALLKGLSKKREDRFADCKSFIKALIAKPKTPSSTTPLSIPAPPLLIPPPLASSTESDPPLSPASESLSASPPPLPDLSVDAPYPPSWPQPVEVVVPPIRQHMSRDIHPWLLGGALGILFFAGLGSMFLLTSKPVDLLPTKVPAVESEALEVVEETPVVVPKTTATATAKTFSVTERPSVGDSPKPVEEKLLSPQFTTEEEERKHVVRNKLWNLPEAKVKAKLNPAGAFGQFTPDGKNFVTVCKNSPQGNVVDIATGKTTAKLFYSQDLCGTDVHPNERLVASGTKFGNIILWNYESGKVVKVFKAHENEVRDIRFSRDGSFFVSGSFDTSAVIWDTSTGSERGRFAGHKQQVYSVAVSADGTLLATGSREGFVRIWDIKSGQEWYRWKSNGYDGAVPVAFSHHGAILAAGMVEGGVVFLDAKSGQPTKRLIGCDSRVISLDFSPDDSRLALGYSNGYRSAVWNAETCMPSYRLPTDSFFGTNTMVFSKDGKTIATCAFDHPTEIWEVPTNEDFVRWGQNLAAKRETAEEIRISDMPPPELVQCDHNFLYTWGKYTSAHGEHDHSLLATAPSKYVFRLHKQWKTFKTHYGLDGRSPSSGADCTFTVKGDDNELFHSEPIQNTLPRPLEVNVQGVELLELIVEPNKNTKSHPAVWFTPVLSRSEVVTKNPSP